jgi:hypothetical protein
MGTCFLEVLLPNATEKYSVIIPAQGGCKVVAPMKLFRSAVRADVNYTVRMPSLPLLVYSNVSQVEIQPVARS